MVDEFTIIKASLAVDEFANGVHSRVHFSGHANCLVEVQTRRGNDQLRQENNLDAFPTLLCLLDDWANYDP